MTSAPTSILLTFAASLPQGTATAPATTSVGREVRSLDVLLAPIRAQYGHRADGDD